MAAQRPIWIFVILFFGSLGSAAYGMFEPFFRSAISIWIGLAYGLLIATCCAWLLSRQPLQILRSGTSPFRRLVLPTFFAGFALVGFFAAATTPGILYSRWFGIEGSWEFSVRSTKFVDFRKHGGGDCFDTRLAEVSWPAGPEDLCLTTQLPVGTKLQFIGKRSIFGIVYRDMRVIGLGAAP